VIIIDIFLSSIRHGVRPETRIGQDRCRKGNVYTQRTDFELLKIKLQTSRRPTKFPLNRAIGQLSRIILSGKSCNRRARLAFFFLISSCPLATNVKQSHTRSIPYPKNPAHIPYNKVYPGSRSLPEESSDSSFIALEIKRLEAGGGGMFGMGRIVCDVRRHHTTPSLRC